MVYSISNNLYSSSKFTPKKFTKQSIENNENYKCSHSNVEHWTKPPNEGEKTKQKTEEKIRQCLKRCEIQWPFSSMGTWVRAAFIQIEVLRKTVRLCARNRINLLWLFSQLVDAVSIHWNWRSLALKQVKVCFGLKFSRVRKHIRKQTCSIPYILPLKRV